MNDTTIITNSPIGQHLDAIGESKPSSYLMFNKKKIELVTKITIGRSTDNDVVVDNKPICNQIEEFAKAQGIDLGKGWKVRLAAMVKREILKGTDKVICESDPENCF